MSIAGCAFLKKDFHSFITGQVVRSVVESMNASADDFKPPSLNASEDVLKEQAGFRQDNLLAVYSLARLHESKNHVRRTLSLYARFILQVKLNYRGSGSGSISEDDLPRCVAYAFNYIQTISTCGDEYSSYAIHLLNALTLSEKIKETLVKDFLNKEFPTLIWVGDNQLKISKKVTMNSIMQGLLMSLSHHISESHYHIGIKESIGFSGDEYDRSYLMGYCDYLVDFLRKPDIKFSPDYSIFATIRAVPQDEKDAKDEKRINHAYQSEVEMVCLHQEQDAKDRKSFSR